MSGHTDHGWVKGAANLRSMEKGTIRIAATPSFGIDFLPGAIASYRDQHTDLMFSIEILRHEELACALLDRRVDIGLALDPDNLPGIGGELLGNGGVGRAGLVCQVEVQ